MLAIKHFLLAVLGINVLVVAILGFNQFNASQGLGRQAILQEVTDPETYQEAEDLYREIIEHTPELSKAEVADMLVSRDQVDLDVLDEDPDMLPEDIPTEIPEEEKNSPYRFTNPALAVEYLKQLDVFSQVGKIQASNYTSVAGGFRPNFEYCDQHRAFIVENPEIIFESNNVITNFWKWHKFRKQVIPMLGAEDLHPNFHFAYGPMTYKFDMRLDANVFYMISLFFYKRQVGVQYSCLSQASNHIPGHYKMYRKDKVGEALVDYAKNYQDRPQCFNYEKWFPKTFILSDKQSCLEFFEEFLSPRYQEMKAERNVVYFRKIGANVHEGKGVFPVNDEEEVKIQNKYKNGTLCGKVKANNLIQYNVHNLLLVKNRKFGFRSFLLVASTNPLIAYYHDGYARLSLNEYDTKSTDKSTFVTNIGVNIKAGSEFAGLTKKEVNDRTCWTMQNFSDHMISTGRVKDPNYLNNTLKPEFKKVMIHLLRMASGAFEKKSSLFETYGLDFVMDENMNLWFIEANTMPLVDGFTNSSTLLLNRMLYDTFDIVRSLIKSRMKRVIVYINALTKEIEAGKDPLVDLDQRRKEFSQLSQNWFEPEFEIRSDNTFERIIYEKNEGVSRYHGLISRECM